MQCLFVEIGVDKSTCMRVEHEAELNVGFDLVSLLFVEPVDSQRRHEIGELPPPDPVYFVCEATGLADLWFPVFIGFLGPGVLFYFCPCIDKRRKYTQVILMITAPSNAIKMLLRDVSLKLKQLLACFTYDKMGG